MAVELRQEQLTYTSNELRNDRELILSHIYFSEESHEVSLPDGEALGGVPHVGLECELNQSESLSFLYNLLYDEESVLTKSDILSILNTLKEREESLPFSVKRTEFSDLQGVSWPSGLRRKFDQDRARLMRDTWFHNVPDSRELAKDMYQTKTNYYRFHKFYSKLKRHIIHFQLRNLVCCCPNFSNMIFYPLSHYYDHNLDMVNNTNNAEDYQNFFKINRLMPDDSFHSKREGMKLDCLIDSRLLHKNTNSRISTMTCSNKFLACGTFEGGYILQDIENFNHPEIVGEFALTSNVDGITNHIVINQDQELIISSNDEALRIVDLNKNLTTLKQFPFAINCLSKNPNNDNECFVTGDNADCFVIDKRTNVFDLNKMLPFHGHKDYGFSCDWSPKDANLLVSGNQDCCVKVWDKRNPKQSLICWESSFGKEVYSQGGPVRNCKFSRNGDFIVWAESLDHAGIIEVSQLHQNLSQLLSVQSIDFIGKCTGMSFAPIECGYGEDLIIGVNDCPLGGILTYRLESRYKPLDFDFVF